MQILLAEKGVPSKLAVHQYEQMLQELPEEPSIHILLARTLMEMEALARSETRFRVALSLAPESFEAHYGLAQCLERQGSARFAEAQAHYEKAVLLNTNHTLVQLDLVRLKIFEFVSSCCCRCWRHPSRHAAWRLARVFFFLQGLNCLAPFASAPRAGNPTSRDVCH